jgi:hypothetical protein
MSIIPIISFSVHLAISTWLLIIIFRHRLWQHLPWFTIYIGSELCGACVGLTLWSIHRRLYVTVYWWMTAAQIILVVGAVRESFIRTFVGFRLLRWFPWLVRGVIAAVIAYSAWKAIYVPAVPTSRLISLLVDGEFAFRWAIVAVAMLAVALERVFTITRDNHEAVILDGCAIASFGVLAWAVVRTLFGMKYSFIAQYFGEVGYLLAAALWIKYLARPDSSTGLQEAGLTPEQVAAELKRYRQAVERLSKQLRFMDCANSA